MVNYSFDFSIIIPHRNSLHFLPKLFSTLPKSDKIQILLIDNSDVPIKKEDIETDAEFELLYSSPSRGAGGARNVGIENAKGKWLIFVDADDYLPTDAFETFYSKLNSDAELIYFGMDGIYSDTNERSDRGDAYTQLVKDYLFGSKTEMDIRLNFSTPCSKMVRRDLVEKHNLRFDEVVASNDVYFSLLTGYYAKKIEAVDKITYIATVTRGSLTKRRDYEVIKSRFIVNLRRNKFLKEHNLAQYQASIMYHLYYSTKYGLNKTFEFIKLCVKFKQSPFIGATRWLRTFITFKKETNRDKKYITIE